MKTLLALACLLAPSARVAPADGPRPTAPLAADPEVRWSFGPFAFECEPRFEDGRVLAAGRDGTGRRALVVLDDASGRMLSRTLLAASAPLELDAAGERVAVRTAPERVELFRLRGARLLAERSFQDAGTLSAPCLEGDELFLREGGELVAHDLTRAEPRWRARVPGSFAGAPAVLGREVLATWLDASGVLHLSRLSRDEGALLEDAALGRTTGGARLLPDGPRVVAHAERVFVHVPDGIPSVRGPSLEWVRVPTEGGRFGSPTLHALLADPLECERGWIAPESLSDGRLRWILAESTQRPGAGGVAVLELAAPDHHAWLAACRVGASRASGVLYLGPCAAAEHDLSVLWRRAATPDYRPVPVPGGLLVVEQGVLRRLAGPAPVPDAHARRAREVAVGLERAQGERLAQLAAKALRAGDAELAERLVPEAEGLGASGRTLDLVRAEAERRRADRPERSARERHGALEVEEVEVRAALPRELAEAAARAADPRDRRALLGELFRRAPEDERGTAVLARLLPPGAAAAEPLAWLEFLERAAARPMAPIDERTGEDPALERERQEWRSDVVGYRSERLRVVTVEARPDAVARTLEAGEILCDEMVRTFGAERLGAEPLELVLYPTREEYLAHSGEDLGGLESVLGFTAGHFDLGARVSRLFLPADDRDGVRLEEVSKHELVHHWLATRSRFAPLRSDTKTTGFWVVEAVATWAEEQRLDPVRREWRPALARAASLDTVRNARPEELLPWSTVLGASFEEYTRLETRPTARLSLDGQLGTSAPRSPLQLFYAQGGALAHFLLHAAGGRERELFLRAVEGWYRGAPLDVAAELGLTTAELGERVAAWARAQAGA